MLFTPHPVRGRLIAMVVAIVVVLAACTDSPEPPAGSETTQTTAPSETTTTTATTTTTVDPGPAILPLGSVWFSDEPLDLVADLDVRAVTEIDGTIWVVGGRDNGPLAMRAVDGGPLEPIDVAGPPADGYILLHGVAAAPDGTILLFGQRGSDCHVGLRVEDGYVRGTMCRVTRGATYRSTDGGASFTYAEPAVMSLGGRQAVRLDGGTHDGTRFVVVGTLRTDDWHGRVWTSPDGVEWALDQELRGDPDTPATMSAVDIHHDGDRYLLVANEHPCAVKPYFNNTPGYILGTDWPSHARLYVGADLASLTLVTDSDLSLAPGPAEVDCDEDDDGFQTARIPYPRLTTSLVGGVLTVIDISTEDAGRTPGTYTVGQWVDGGWVVSTFDATAAIGPTGETDPEADFRLVDAVDLDGLALVGTRGDNVRLLLARPVEDTWTLVAAQTFFPLDNGQTHSAIAVGDEVWAFSYEYDIQNYTQSLLRWRSRAATEDEIPRCEPGPGAQCAFADLSTVDGYPNFAGVDWTGIDLREAILADGVYDGVSFRDARLGRARTRPDVSMVGADFTGANLRSASLDGLDGVILTGANLHSAFLYFVGMPTSWDDVELSNVRLRFDPAMGPIDLAGVDLTNANVGSATSDDLLVIGDLRGATVDRLAFVRVDLSGADVDGIDLSLMRFDEDSICPDGSPTVEGSAFGWVCEP